MHFVSPKGVFYRTRMIRLPLDGVYRFPTDVFCLPHSQTSACLMWHFPWIWMKSSTTIVLLLLLLPSGFFCFGGVHPFFLPNDAFLHFPPLLHFFLRIQYCHHYFHLCSCLLRPLFHCRQHSLAAFHQTSGILRWLCL